MALPNLGQLLFPLPQETKNLIRRYERLSFKMRQLKRANPDSVILIKKGELTHNGQVVDKFDITNQIFP